MLRSWNFYALSAPLSAVLLSSASLLTLAGTMSAHAQDAQAPVQVAAAAPSPAPTQVAADAAPGRQVEEVLVTGSLIHGTAAVGVPVTSLSDEEFKTTGAVTVADLFKNVPAVYMIPQNDVMAGGGYIARAQNVNLRNLSTRGTRTLLLIDGMRFTSQGKGSCQLDPSIIPQLAVDHIDLLADGASATYGSDAVAGVINVLMKRGFEGATSQLQFSVSQDLGHATLTGSQLYGTKWNTGDVTMSLEWYKTNHTGGLAIPALTQDFWTAQGYDDRRSILNSRPGIVSLGAPTIVAGAPAGFSATTGQSCGNCFSVPTGQNGVGLAWTTLLANAGVKNQINLFGDGWAEPQQRRTAGTITFDQEIVPKVSLFVDAWYSNRRAIMHGQAGGNSFTGVVPTINPYYPIGAPTGLRVSYDINLELAEPDRVNSVAVDSRYDFGLNLDLPFNWTGKVYYETSQDHNIDHTTGTVGANMISAALGNTIASVAATNAAPAVAAFAKPASVPYLNLFCDPTKFTCNSQATLDYLSTFSYNDENAIVAEYGANADGALLDLPGGTLKLALGAEYTKFSYNLKSNASNGTNAKIVNFSAADGTRTDTSFFAQLNIPVVSEGMQIPLVESLEIESGRYDDYSDFGSTRNPKVALDWVVGDGLTIRSSWGTAFRAPSFQEAALGGPGAINIVAGASSDTIATCPTIGATAIPGTAAALIDPNCASGLQFLGGLSSGYNPNIRGPNYALKPETAMNVSAEFVFTPTDMFGGVLKGLDIEGTYWFIKITGLLNNYFSLFGIPSGSLDSTIYAPAFLTAVNDPNFAQDVQTLLSDPRSTLQPSIATSIKFIADNGVRNIGWQAVNGLDFSASYDWDMEKWGAYNVGLSGTYVIDNKTLFAPGQAVVSLVHTPAVSGSTALDNGGWLKYRGHIGWSDEDSIYSVTAFLNFLPHVNSDSAALPPACFLLGNTACNASGLPQFSKYTAQYPVLTDYVPGQYTFDLSLSYQTHDAPANEYLKNIRVQLTINNILNKEPPFAYQINPPGGAAPHAYFSTTAGSSLGIDGRVFALAVTKEW